jgi:hypothetical protein
LGDLTLATKWDRVQLKKQVGSVLNDVQTVSDTAFAELVLGLTLEEILEPLDRIQNPGEAHVDTMLWPNLHCHCLAPYYQLHG